MVKTTKEQRKALKRVYDRQPFDAKGRIEPQQQYYGLRRALSYREFRQHHVQPGPGCIMVAWCGMWLGIEPDGYTHS